MPGPLLSRLTQLRALTLALEYWPERKFPPAEPIDIEDCHEVYGDNVIEMFPEIRTPCDLSPTGQCEYDATAADWRRCKHCKKRTG